MKTQDIKNRFITLRARGFSYDKIAKQLAVSKQTLINWGKDLHAEIEALKALELEILREKYYLLKEKRIELFGEEILKIRRELSQRDLKKVQTHRLIDLLIKIYSLFDREEKADVDVDKKRIDMRRVKSLLGDDKDEPKFYIICTDFIPGRKVPKGDHVIDLTGENWRKFIDWKKECQK